jgi:hypothetical protein
MRNQRIGFPFIGMGIAFIAISFSGQRAFLPIGVVFLILGLVLIRRAHR